MAGFKLCKQDIKTIKENRNNKNNEMITWSVLQVAFTVAEKLLQNEYIFKRLDLIFYWYIFTCFD